MKTRFCMQLTFTVTQRFFAWSTLKGSYFFENSFIEDSCVPALAFFFIRLGDVSTYTHSLFLIASRSPPFLLMGRSYNLSAYCEASFACLLRNLRFVNVFGFMKYDDIIPYCSEALVFSLTNALWRSRFSAELNKVELAARCSCVL